MAWRDDLLSEYLRQQKLKDDEEEEEEPSKDKPLHGKRQIEVVADLQRSYQRLVEDTSCLFYIRCFI